MLTLEALKRQIKSTRDLGSVVRTMKALAAVNIREYEKAVEALSEYIRTIELGFQIVLRNGMKQEAVRYPPGRSSMRRLYRRKQVLGAIVFGSDQGMVGGFNDQIASYAIRQIHETGPQPDEKLVLAIGERVGVSLDGGGHSVEDVFPVPGSAEGITRMVQETIIRIDRWQTDKGVNRVVLFYHNPKSNASYDPVMVNLVPVDMERIERLGSKKWESRSLPFYNMDRKKLFSMLIRQYTGIALYRAFAESLASENASRLVSMQAAEKNIEERYESLTAQYNKQRQNAITSEILDIVGGFEVLGGENG